MRQLQRHSQLMKEQRNREVSLGMEDSFAGILEVRVDFLFGEVQGVRPVQYPALLGFGLSDGAVVVLLQLTEGQTGVKHQQGVVKIEAVGDCVLSQQDVLPVHT